MQDRALLYCIDNFEIPPVMGVKDQIFLTYRHRLVVL